METTQKIKEKNLVIDTQPEYIPSQFNPKYTKARWEKQIRTTLKKVDMWKMKLWVVRGDKIRRNLEAKKGEDIFSGRLWATSIELG